MLKTVKLSKLLIGLVLAGVASVASAENVSVAVAANFREPLQDISAKFQRATGHTVSISAESSGKIVSQIKNGASYDIFLSADETKPIKLEQEGGIVPGSRFTYAIGKLALWSATPGYVDNKGKVLKTGSYNHIAIADPKLAPYGLAATQTLQKMGLTAAVNDKLVVGKNIGTTFGYIQTGNAELGFVALSQIYKDGRLTHGGSYWLVPKNYYKPIRQDAVLLPGGKDNPAAVALMKYLKSPAARKVMKSYGYSN